MEYIYIEGERECVLDIYLKRESVRVCVMERERECACMRVCI